MSYGGNMVHPWLSAFNTNFSALTSLAGQIPVALIPTYADLMKAGVEISLDLSNGLDVTNEEGQDWLNEAALFSRHLQSSQQGNIAQTSQQGLDAGEGLQPYWDGTVNTAYNAAQAVQSTITAAQNAANTVNNIPWEDIIIGGAVLLGAVFILPALLRGR
jgi:hypothetical protein